MRSVQYCSIKRKLAKGLWYVPGTLLELYGVYILFIARYCMYIYSCTQEVQDVHYYCSVEVFIKKFDPAYFAFFGKMYSPFCLHNCLFLFTAYIAKNSASKFCQGLPTSKKNRPSSAFLFGRVNDNRGIIACARRARKMGTRLGFCAQGSGGKFPHNCLQLCTAIYN